MANKEKINQALTELTLGIDGEWLMDWREAELRRFLSESGVDDVQTRMDNLRTIIAVQRDLALVTLPAHTIPFQEKLDATGALERLNTLGISSELINAWGARSMQRDEEGALGISRQMTILADQTGLSPLMREALNIPDGE